MAHLALIELQLPEDGTAQTGLVSPPCTNVRQRPGDFPRAGSKSFIKLPSEMGRLCLCLRRMELLPSCTPVQPQRMLLLPPPHELLPSCAFVQPQRMPLLPPPHEPPPSCTRRRIRPSFPR